MTEHKTTPNLLNLLEQRLREENLPGAKRITGILYHRDGRARKQCYNLFLSFASADTNPEVACLQQVLEIEHTADAYLDVATLLCTSNKSTIVSDLLRNVQPSVEPEPERKYFAYLVKLQTGQSFNLKKFTASFLATHRSNKTIDPKEHAGYKKFSFLCMYAFTFLKFSDEIHSYLSLLFNHILREKNWRWQQKSEKLYLSFFLWLYEKQLKTSTK